LHRMYLSKFMNRRCLRSPHDVEGNGLMRVAAEAFHFEIAITRVERVAQRGRWLRRTLKAQHALVPRLAGEPVGFLAGFDRDLRSVPDRRAVDCFSRFGTHAKECDQMIAVSKPLQFAA
jgi:hypothetical protein